jgi:hypothetical protein
MDLRRISSAADFQKVKHPHFGSIQRIGFVQTTFGIFTGVSCKADAIEDYSSGECQTVALEIDPQDFMVTIANSFVLVTVKAAAGRLPIIMKRWRRVAKTNEGIGAGGNICGKRYTYVDSDGMRWEHGFGAPDKRGFFVGFENESDQLVAFDANGERITVFTLQTFR